MADLTVSIDCPKCGDPLEVPLTIVSSALSTTPGHALVTVEADPEFIAEHEATHISATTLADVAPELLPPTIIR